MVSGILLETLREFYFSQQPCRIFVSYVRSVSFYTGVIEKLDNEFILLKDKYDQKVTIKCRDILRVENPPEDKKNSEKKPELEIKPPEPDTSPKESPENSEPSPRQTEGNDGIF